LFSVEFPGVKLVVGSNLKIFGVLALLGVYAKLAGLFNLLEN